MENNKILAINVTPKCNMDCAFCFGPKKSEKELSTNEIKLIIDNANRKGTKKIIFTGGEPLLRKDIFELIEYTKDLGLFTILHTNGLLLNRDNLKALERYLDQINLPLDGADEEINDDLRIRGHFNKIFEILSLLKNKKIRIIISTVVSSKNIRSVGEIGRILPEYVNKWRIFQFKPERKAGMVRREFEISDKEYEEECDKIIKNKYPFKIQCIGKNNTEFEKSYKII